MRLLQRRAVSIALILLSLAGRGLAADRAELVPRLAEQIDASVKAGEKNKTWIDVLGKRSEVQVSGADTKTLTILMQGNPFPISWEKVSDADLLTVAKSTAAGKGERLLLAAEVALALKQADAASELINQAKQADASLADKANAIAAKLPDAPTPPPPPPKPAEGAPASTSMTSTPNSGTSLIAAPKRGSVQPRKEHPRLLFDNARLAAVKARAANPDGKKFLAYLKGMPTDCDSRSYALAWVVSGDPVFASHAIQLAQKIVSGGPIAEVTGFDGFGDVALVYDWCYTQLSEPQRKEWQEWFVKGYDKTKDLYLEGYHNYGMRGAWGFALAGYAIQGENPRAAELLDNAYNKRWRTLILPACKAGLAGGAWAEGEGYGVTTGMAPFELAMAALCAEGKDLFAEAPEFFAGRLAFLMFLDEPGVVDKGRRLWLNGDMNRRRNWDDALQQRLLLQESLRGTDIAAYAQTFSELPAANTRQFYSEHWIDVMWRDRTAPQKPLESFKLSHLAWGRGTVLMRSDWSEEATHVGFTAGPLIAASHGHADAGHFSIWKGGELATVAGDYRGTGNRWALDAFKRTASCNSLLILDPAEKFTVRHEKALNDGGQLWSDEESNLIGAKIVAYDARRAYTYVCADLTPAYLKSKAAVVRRQLVYIRPDTVIVADRVVSTNPNFQKQWQCYLAGKATIADKTFSTDNGKCRLKGEVLLPADAKLVLQTGQDKAVDVFGTKVAQPAGGQDDGPSFRVDVRPGAARTDDCFLVVMRAHEGPEPPATTIKDKGSQISINIPNVGEVILNTDGTPGGSVCSHALATTVVSQEE